MYVYCTINKTTGKKYVGMCSKSINKTKNYFGSGILIMKSINKNGKQNFEKEILEECCNIDFLIEREKYWIGKLMTLHPNGYNLESGGSGSVDQKVREKIGKGVSGENNGMFGKHHTEETKNKVSEMHKNHMAAKDKEGNYLWILTSDPRYLSGELIHPSCGVKQSLESNRKRSKTQTGKKRSAEIIKKTSGSGNGMFGKNHTEESKKKESYTKKSKTPEQKLEFYKKWFPKTYNKIVTQEQLDRVYNKYKKDYDEYIKNHQSI